MSGAASLLNFLNGSPAGVGATPATRGAAAATGPAAGSAGFSNMLQQAREQNARQAEQRPRAEPRAPQPPAPPARPQPAPEQPASTPEAAAPAPAAPPAQDAAPPATQAERPVDRKEAKEATDTQPPADLAGLPWAPLMSEGSGEAAGLPSTELAEEGAALEGRSGQKRRGAEGLGRAGEERPGLVDARQQAAEPPQAAFDQQLEAQLAGSEATSGAEAAAGPSAIEAPAGTLPAGALHAAAPAGQSAPAATAEAQASVAVPVDSPEFPEALASQITYLVRDGVQQAKLMLNPVDMGPLTVQIALQGQQAQVDFMAANAGTRAALEASVAELAAALQGAGFTLTGGGVSQQSSQGQSSGAGNGRQEPARPEGPESLAGNAATPAPAATRRVRQGALDLFA